MNKYYNIHVYSVNGTKFNKGDGPIHIWDRNSDKLKTTPTPTNAKDDRKLIRRLLMEVSSEL